MPGREDVWDLWEQRLGLQPRGHATDFWERYPEDVGLARALGCRAFRFSIAWSRVEPVPGEYDDAAFDHYRQMIRTIHDAGMEPFVTLLHFTWPVHVEQRGGLIADDFPDIFERYVAEVVARLGDGIRYWIPINEPNGLVYGYVKPWWQQDYASPPGLPEGATLEDQFEAVGKVMRNLFLAHSRARVTIKRGYPDALVGSNPLPLGLPGPLQRLLDWNASRLASEKDLLKHGRRFAVRPLRDHGAADVVVATLTRTRKRAEQVAFSADYHVASQVLLARAISSVTVPADLAGRAVAVVKGSTAEDDAATVVPGARVQVVDDYPAALAALDHKRVEAILADEPIVRGLIHAHPDDYKLVGGPLKAEPYVVAVPHGNRELLNVVDHAIGRLKRSEGALASVPHENGSAVRRARPVARTLTDVSGSDLARRAVERQVAPKEPLPLARPGSALRRIQDRGYLIAAVRTDVPGFGYRDPATGTYSGVEIDLVREIARQIFGDPAKVRFRPARTPERIPLLRSPLAVLDPLLKLYSIVSTGLTSNWWHLGMAGKLAKFLCPPSCIGQQDFVALDYYWGIRSLRPDRLYHLIEAAARRFDRAPVWPGALYSVLTHYARLFPDLPIVICENGSVDVADGVDRATYLRRHVRQVQRAVRDGARVVAYICWSITSNREWGTTFGQGNDFGLYHVELDTDPDLRRQATPAVAAFEEIIARRAG